MEGMWSEIETLNEEQLIKLLGLRSVKVPSKTVGYYINGEKIKGFPHKEQGELIDLPFAKKWTSLSDEQIQKTELKCIYCQLFINKYLRAK